MKNPYLWTTEDIIAGTPIFDSISYMGPVILSHGPPVVIGPPVVVNYSGVSTDMAFSSQTQINVLNNNIFNRENRHNLKPVMLSPDCTVFFRDCFDKISFGVYEGPVVHAASSFSVIPEKNGIDYWYIDITTDRLIFRISLADDNFTPVPFDNIFRIIE